MNGTEVYRYIASLNFSGGIEIAAENLIWKSPQEGIKCQALKVGSKGWQQGDLRLEVNLAMVNRDIDHSTTQAWVRFCTEKLSEK